MKNVKTNKGITLIALVVTIIVLLILAAVTIGLVLGQNGIIGKANKAKSATDIASGKDQVQLALANVVADKLENGQTTSDIKAEELQTELQKTDSSASVTGSNPNFTAKYHVNGTEYEYGINTSTQTVTAPEIGNAGGDNTKPETEEVGAWTKLNRVATNGSFDESKGVNSPKLGTELTAVTLTSDINQYKTNGTWYDYVAQTGTTESGGTSKWANAVTTDTDGSITGYYVWIPRYAYKITSGYHSSTAGTIEIKFLKGATNEFADGTGTAETDPSRITYTGDAQNEWLVHPAFLSDASIGGGFGTKSGNDDGITGLWVAKFETSAFIDGSDTSTREISSTTAEQQIKLRVIPGVQSSSVVNIGEMYKLSYSLNRNSDSHMMKNSEWGAVAYLSWSKYGRNKTEVSNNSTMYEGQGASNQDTYTGGSNTETGYLTNGLQSTTGNAYGIYDMNGGKAEYTAAYINDDSQSSLTTYGGELYTTAEGKYKNVYNKSTSGSRLDNYNQNSTIKGDAVYETSNMITDYGNYSWNSECSYFPGSYNPFFIRSGFYLDTYAGMFYFSSDIGYGGDSGSWRLALEL